MSLERLISMTAACALAALAFSGSPAAAQQPDDTWGKAACMILPNSALGIGGAVNSISTDAGQGQSYDPLQLMDTDPSTFTFAGLGYCEGEDVASEWVGKGGGTGPEIFAQQVRILAKGIYDNLICGTGSATGTVVVTDDPGPADVTDADIEIHSQFALDLVAGRGRLSLVVQGAPALTGQGSHSHIGESEVDQGTGGGVIEMRPIDGAPGGEPCVGTPGVQKSGDAHFWLVEGAFETTLAGEGATAIDPTSDSDM